MNDPVSTPKLVYLDVCALSRPFDDQQQLRIRLETAAVELILAHVRRGVLALVVSPVHSIEIESISDPEEFEQLVLLLQECGYNMEFDLPTTHLQAEGFVRQGLGIADAAHVAFAVQAQAEFISVDDRLLKQCRRIGVPIWCGTPQAFCEKENLR